jgi:hypothetical protein
MDIVDKPFVTQEQKIEYWQESKSVIKSLRAQLAECQWISVDDRLPELHRRVLVKGDSTFVAGLQEVDSISANWGIRGDLYWGLVNDVWENLDTTTHWMLLPQPPQAMR